jgi:hypothetical protein
MFGNDLIGWGNLATATNSQLSSYNPILVINGVKNEPVISTDDDTSICSKPAYDEVLRFD